MSDQIIKTLLFSSLITFIATPVVLKIALLLNLVDNPKIRNHPAHTHKGIIPRAGGIALFIGIFLPLFFLLPQTKALLGIFLGGLVLVIIGILDDRPKELSPYLRLFLIFIAAGLAIAGGVGIPFITNPMGGVINLDTLRISFNFFGPHSILPIADIFAFLWIVWAMTFVGWSGGVDGQLPGFVSVAAIVIGLISFRFTASDQSQFIPTTLAFLTAGSYLGFLPWNFYPQKIMPGYGGKTLAGYMLAVTSILSSSKLGTSIMVLGLPLIDALFMVISRLLSKKSPVWGSGNHLHHKLLQIGWGRRRIAVFYIFISSIMGIFALVLESKQKFFVFILLFILTMMFFLWVNLISRFKNIEEEY
ncbi:MAG: Glycosyl transferase family 4 [Candidatus Gottesmanbacteria bacterium GW2011_GWA2_41_12]|uniref:Glycosyl transferase family 4 n=2 Tax=Candidatus Gottesmaniibacteriota TaxID=1752720 RepID=A0A0G0XLT4_9BACT|nr:MAG: Glycosyl transferase family 4 [Candidatus Gottesmanbacteria bacterium GW2011_GWC2_39_8]KKR88612.1 MAG: Glycosyl transferase family 4 [Candidatus Gottesmanbacteria bacterium GW2011_GWA2_41_12]